MKIKKYTGKEQQEIMNRIKLDLGLDAVILTTKKVKQKGVLGLFTKPLIEVTAAVQDKKVNKVVSNSAIQNYKEATTENKNLAKDDALNNLKSKNENKFEDKIEDKIDKIEEMLSNLVTNKSIESKPPEKLETVDKFQGVYRLFFNNLKNNGVQEEIVEKIIEQVEELSAKNKNQSVSNILYNRIIFLLGKPEKLEPKESNKPYIVAFVGPTGVGKTTTIAKLAANVMLKENKKVGFITADTYRIGAVEQLKTYSDILGVETKVVYDEDDIRKSIEELKENDFIFIDTAGRSHKNDDQMKELETVFEEFKANKTYLVMNASTNTRDALDIIEKYKFIQDFDFIFTKMDETSVHGLILNMKYLTKKNLSYVTIGQNVPDDIVLLDIENISKKLIGST